MRTKFLATVASFAFVASGVAFAQDNPKQENRPAAPAAARQEAPRADTQRMQAPRAADEGVKNDMQKPRTAQDQPMRGQDAQGQPRPAGAMQRKDNAQAEPGVMQRKDNAQAEPGAMRKDNAQAEPGGAMQRRDTARMAKPGDKDRTADRGEPRVTGNINISREHVSRVGEALRREGRPERVDIDIRVGVRVPRNVEVRPLPAEVITLVPEYRGYNYFLGADDQIVFVSPETNEIVGTIDYEGRAASDDAPRVAGARPCPIEN